MKAKAIMAVVAVVLTFPVAPSLAVVGGITDLSEFADPASPYYGMNWDYVYPTRGGTSVAVGNFTLITADHYPITTMEDSSSNYDTLAINGDTWAVASAENLAPDPGQSYQPDIRVLHMTNLTNPYRALPGFYDLYEYEGSVWPAEAKSFVIVGSGDTGSTAASNYYTDEEGTRAMRWGTNRFEGVSLVRRFATRYDGTQYSTLTFKMRYNQLSNPTPHESGLGVGDSGCGVFVLDGDEWKLAGLGLYRDPYSLGYSNFFAASIPNYADRIPEPALLTGDFDGDGDVDNADIGLAIGNYTGSSGTGMSYFDGDIDGDGDVDNADIGYIVGAFTGTMSSASPSSPVPEPAALFVMLAAGLPAMLKRRRSRS